MKNTVGKKYFLSAIPGLLAAIVSLGALGISEFQLEPEIDQLEMAERKYPICYGPFDGKLYAKVPINQAKCDANYDQIMEARRATYAVSDKRDEMITIYEIGGAIALVWCAAVFAVFLLLRFIIPIFSASKTYLVSKSTEIQVRRYKELKDLGVLTQEEFEEKVLQARQNLG